MAVRRWKQSGVHQSFSFLEENPYSFFSLRLLGRGAEGLVSSMMSSSSWSSILGASLPFLLMTRFSSLFSLSLGGSSWAVLTRRTISLCLSWLRRSSFSFSSRMSFLRSSSFLRSLRSRSRARIFSLPSFSMSARWVSSCLTSSSSCAITCSLISSELGFFSLSLFSISLTFSSLTMQASCSLRICFSFSLMASTCFLVFCVSCLSSSSMRLILLAVSLSSLFLRAFSWVLRIFSRESFSSSRALSCPLRCLSSFSFSTILLMSYLLSRLRRSLAISALFFWMRSSWSLSSFLSSITRSSSQPCPAVCFFFFRSFSFSTISSILVASSFSCPFSLMCCSISFAFLHPAPSTLSLPPSPQETNITPIDHSQFYINMEAFIDAATQELKEDPTRLNEITERVLKEAANHHHPLNRLLPASFVQVLLAHIAPEALLGSNEECQGALLATNCLRGILITNFAQLQQNKVFRAVVANYAQTLNQISRQERQAMEEGSGSLRFAARGFLLSEIMLKMVQLSHVFVPEVLRFARIALELAVQQLERNQEETQQKELRMATKLAEKSKIPSHLYKLACRKVWKKFSFIVFAKSLFEQAKTFLTTCGYSKHALGLDIYREILELHSRFKSLLAPDQIAYLSLEETSGEAEAGAKEVEAVYLEEPVQVRELTPRFYDEEQAAVLSKLRRKKLKLTKKIETDLRKSVVVKQQEAQVREEVRREKGARQRKKEQLVIERQTVEVKKYNRQIKKVKQARKAKPSAPSKPAGARPPAARPRGKR